MRDALKPRIGKQILKDDKVIFAVIRVLETVGEATKKIPYKIRAKYPEIPWKEIADLPSSTEKPGYKFVRKHTKLSLNQHLCNSLDTG
ncbi:hypothetical protein HRbin37_02108 [bacterium HR37]|nr:hypothetical protein HRbin37_02108 [bacterium HR37]